MVHGRPIEVRLSNDSVGRSANNGKLKVLLKALNGDRDLSWPKVYLKVGVVSGDK